MELPEAILMDLDNTILAFDTAVVASFQVACHRMSLEEKEFDEDTLLQAVMACRDQFWSDSERNHWGRHNTRAASVIIVSNTFRLLNVGDPRKVGHFVDLQLEYLDNTIAPFPGAIEMLEQLKNRGIPLALLTNGGSDVQRRKIDKFNLSQYFTQILIEGEISVGKPHPRVFRRALRRLEVSPSHAWMVGDQLETDVRPAQELGMTGIWLDWEDRGLPTDGCVIPHRIINGLNELLDE